MTLEELKKDLKANLAISSIELSNSDYYSGYDRRTREILCKLETLDLPDPDAKLRKVREEIKNGDRGYMCPVKQDNFHQGYHVSKDRVLAIIDAHLSPKKPEFTSDEFSREVARKEEQSRIKSEIARLEKEIAELKVEIKSTVRNLVMSK